MVNITRKMVNLIQNLSLNENVSIHALSLRSKEPYTTVHRSTTKLQKLGVVTTEQKGQARFVSLNFNEESTRYILGLGSRMTATSLLQQEPILNLVSEKFTFNSPLLLFGSRAKKAARKKSDIDLCVIGLSVKDKKEFKRFLHQTELIHKKELNCLFFTRKEFTAMLMSKDHTVGKEIYLHHVVLNNADLWYNLIAEVHDDVRL